MALTCEETALSHKLLLNFARHWRVGLLLGSSHTPQLPQPILRNCYKLDTLFQAHLLLFWQEKKLFLFRQLYPATFAAPARGAEPVVSRSGHSKPRRCLERGPFEAGPGPLPTWRPPTPERRHLRRARRFTGTQSAPHTSEIIPSYGPASGRLRGTALGAASRRGGWLNAREASLAPSGTGQRVRPAALRSASARGRAALDWGNEKWRWGNRTAPRRTALGSLSPLARGGASRRRRGPRLSREDGASRERRRPRLPVAIAAGDEGGRGEGTLRAAAGSDAGR